LLPWGFLVSGNLQHQTGRPWARQLRVNGLGFPNNPSIYMEPLDGSRRLPNLDLIDTRLQKSISLGHGSDLDLFIDALNLTIAKFRKIDDGNDWTGHESLLCVPTALGWPGDSESP